MWASTKLEAQFSAIGECELRVAHFCLFATGPKKTRTRLSERLSSKTGFLKQQASHVWALKPSKVLHALGFRAPKMGFPSVSLLCNLHVSGVRHRAL